MPQNLRGILTLAAIILIAGFATSPSAAKSRLVRGVVTDEANLPVPNAPIQLSCARTGHVTKVVSTLSRADGGFQFQITLRGVCKVSIDAPGFAPILISISGSDKRKTVDLGPIRLRISCAGPGVTCDQVTPANAKP